MPFPLKIAPFHGGSETPSHTWFLGPTQLIIPNGILSGSAIYAQLMADSPYTLRWDSLPPEIAHSYGDLDSRLIHCSMGLPESTTQTSSRLVQPFLHSSRRNVPILYSGPLIPPPQNCPFPWGDLDPPSNTWFLGTT